jgi:polysaccharide export outer membrane protein
MQTSSFWIMTAVAGGLCLSAQPVVRQSLMEDAGKENLPAQILGIDDLVAVSVYDAPELTRTVRVEPDGFIHLPLLENGVKAAGLLPRELEAGIAAALKQGEILVDPIVKLTVVEYHSRPIAVIGAVRKPLTFQAVGTVTLVDALARAEGLTTDAGMEVLLTREPGKTEHISVKQLIDNADPSVNVALHGGEEVRVPDARKIVVVGNVKKSGAFAVRDSENSVLRVLALAEGLLPFTGKEAYIYRRDESGLPQEITVELGKILQRKVPDVPLQADDVLYIPDRSGKRMTAEVLNRLTGIGGNIGAGFAVYH